MALTPTTRLGARYPNLAQAADLAFLLQTLATDLDGVVVKYKEDTHLNRPAAGTHGYIYLETDTGILFYDNGTTWQVVGASNRIGLYSARPVANSVPAGTSYYATDKDVPYISDGSAWFREDTAPGDIFVTLNTSAATGRVLLQGQTISRTGLNDELFAKWGTAYNTGGEAGTDFRLPDMRGRVPVDLGTHADVSTLGNNDGVAVANRRPKHNSTPNLTLPNHVHSTVPATARVYDVPGANNINSGVGDSAGPDSSTATLAIGNPTALPAIPGTIGPGGTAPVDAPAYFVVQFEAKL